MQMYKWLNCDNFYNPGLVGLAISYALSVTNLLNGVVTSFTETEKQMVSVERAAQYIEEVPQESARATLHVGSSFSKFALTCIRNYPFELQIFIFPFIFSADPTFMANTGSSYLY